MNRKASQVTIMVLDQDPLVHIGLESVLRQRPDFHVVGKARTVQEARAMLDVSQPDVLLIDDWLPDCSSTEACTDFLQSFPGLRVLFLSTNLENSVLLSAILAGASGFLLKESAMNRFGPVIELVVAGYLILEQSALTLVQKLIGQYDGPPGIPDQHLSPQQRRIVELVVKGQTNREIASTLGLSEKTVRNYLATVFKKLHIPHRSEIISLFSLRTQD